VVRAGTEATLSTLRTVADAMAGEDFPTFVTEAGVRGEWLLVWVWTSQGVKRVFIGEDMPELSLALGNGLGNARWTGVSLEPAIMLSCLCVGYRAVCSCHE